MNDGKTRKPSGARLAFSYLFLLALGFRTHDVLNLTAIFTKDTLH